MQIRPKPRANRNWKLWNFGMIKFKLRASNIANNIYREVGRISARELASVYEESRNLCRFREQFQFRILAHGNVIIKMI